MRKTFVTISALRAGDDQRSFRACDEAGITVTLPKPMTSNAKAAGRFGKQDFRYVAAEDAYVCSAGQGLAYSFTTEDRGVVLRRYRTNACQRCAIKHRCTTGKERLISRWEHEAVLETVQARLDQHPEKMTMRRTINPPPLLTVRSLTTPPFRAVTTLWNKAPIAGIFPR